MRKTIKTLTLLFLLCCSSITLSANAASLFDLDYTGIWKGTDSTGWGVNLAQTNNFIFATFFVYDKDGKREWYTAELTSVPNHTYSDCFTGSIGTPPPFAYDGPEAATFCGVLYKTTPSSMSSSDIWIPEAVKTVQIGGVRLGFYSPTEGVFSISSYQEGKIHDKPIVLQTLTLPYIPENLPKQYSIRINPNGVGNNSSRQSYMELSIALVQPVANKPPKKIDLQIGSNECSFTSDSIKIAGQYLILREAEVSCSFDRETVAKGTGDVWLKFTKTQGVEGYYSFQYEGENTIHKGHFSGV